MADRLFLTAAVTGAWLLVVHWRSGLVALFLVIPALYWWRERELDRAIASEAASTDGQTSDATSRQDGTQHQRGSHAETRLRPPPSDSKPRSPATVSASPVSASRMPGSEEADGNRILEFPVGRSFGTVYTRSPSDVWHGSNDWWPTSLGKACRTISIPAHRQVRLWGSQREDDGTRRSPTELTPLRHFDADALDSLYVSSCAEEQLRCIEHLEGLQELCLHHGLDDEMLSNVDFTGLTQLRGFQVAYTKTTDRTINPLIDRYRNLRYLYVNGTGIGDDTLRSVANLEKLRVFEASKTELTDVGARVLSELTDLAEIDLSGTQVTNAGISGFGALRSIERLSLRGTRIDDHGLSFLAGAYELRSLNLAETRVTGRALAEAGPLPRLEYLDLSGSHLTEEGLAAIGSLGRLTGIRLDDMDLTDDGIRYLHGLPNLRSLFITDTGITPAGLLALIESLPRLNSLYIGMTPARSSEAIEEMKSRLRVAPSGAARIRRTWEPPTETRDQPWPGTWEPEQLPPSAGRGDIRDIAEDPSGRLWVASFGPFEEERPSWLKSGWTPPPEGPVVIDMATAVGTGSDGTVYVAHDRELWVFRDGGWSRLIEQVPGSLNDIAVGRDGTAWAIRGRDTLYSVRNGTVKERKLDFNDNELLSVAVDTDGTVWIGSFNALTRFRDGSWHTWKGAADGLPVDPEPDMDSFAWERDDCSPIHSVAIDPRSNTVWVAGSGGIARYANDGFELCASLEDLPYFFRSISVDDHGRLVAAGGRRLASWVDGEWRVAEVPRHLMEDDPRGFGNRIEAVHSGPAGIWVGSNRGALLRFSPDAP